MIDYKVEKVEAAVGEPQDIVIHWMAHQGDTQLRGMISFVQEPVLSEPELRSMPEDIWWQTARDLMGGDRVAGIEAAMADKVGGDPALIVIDFD